jgi:hypothetical protein
LVLTVSYSRRAKLYIPHTMLRRRPSSSWLRGGDTRSPASQPSAGLRSATWCQRLRQGRVSIARGQPFVRRSEGHLWWCPKLSKQLGAEVFEEVEKHVGGLSCVGEEGVDGVGHLGELYEEMLSLLRSRRPWCYVAVVVVSPQAATPCQHREHPTRPVHPASAAYIPIVCSTGVLKACKVEQTYAADAYSLSAKG